MVEITRTIDEWGELHNLRLGNNVDWKKKIDFQEFSDMLEKQTFTHRISPDDLMMKIIKQLVEAKEVE